MEERLSELEIRELLQDLWETRSSRTVFSELSCGVLGKCVWESDVSAGLVLVGVSQREGGFVLLQENVEQGQLYSGAGLEKIGICSLLEFLPCVRSESDG